MIVGTILKKTEKRLNEEIERVSEYLDVQREIKITNVVKTEMIETHMTRLIHMNNSGLVNMISGDKYKDLGRMYKIFRRVPNGLTLIRGVMTSHIWKTGR